MRPRIGVVMLLVLGCATLARGALAEARGLSSEARNGRVDASALAPAVHGRPLSRASCLPYIVIDSRGSGEAYGTSPPGARFVQELRWLKGADNVGLIDNPYPASGNFALVGAFLDIPGSYHDSVVAGKDWLRNKLASETRICGSSGTEFFLTGYSQGAQVTADVYQERSYPDVVGVALFGDPYFDNRDGFVDRGTYRPNLWGSLGRRPVFDESERRHVESFCHLHDPVCQGSDRSPTTLPDFIPYGTSQHKNYDALGEPESAARYFASLTTPTAASGDSPPVVLRVDNTAGRVGGPDFWARVTYSDPDCDVVGGMWIGGDGASRVFGIGGPADCTNGVGSLTAFSLTCSAPGQPAGRWTEYVVLQDARGQTSARFAFTHACSR